MVILGKQYCKYCFAENNSAEECTCKREAERHPAALPLSTILKNRYFVGMVLGKGGFGITYLCFDSIEKRRVAIKEFYPGALVVRAGNGSNNLVYSENDGESVTYGLKKFEDEARILNKLQNAEDIVNVFDYFSENNTAYVVMEYLDGTDLKQYMEKCGGKIAPEECAYIMMRVTKALECIHENSIYHRDIAPDNIHILPDGSIKLLDFGAAKQMIGQQTGSIAAVFKKGFTPPEQYQTNGMVGPQTDIYALGATIYCCITGEIPEEALARYGNDTVEFTEEKGIPTEFASVLKKALAVDIRDRYANSIELKNDLYASGMSYQVPKVERAVPKPHSGVVSGSGYIYDEPIPMPSSKVIRISEQSEIHNSKNKNIILIIILCVIAVLIAISVFLLVKFSDKNSNGGTHAGGSSDIEVYLPEYSSVKKDENGNIMYSVKIDPNGGEYPSKLCVYLYNGDEFVLDTPVPPPDKHVSLNINGKINTINSTYEFSHWTVQKEKIEDGKIVINGMSLIAKAVYVQKPIVLPDAFTEGLTFIGWYTQINNGKFVGFAGDEFKPVKDTTLYACFETPEDDPSLDENTMYYETEYYGNENSVAIKKYIGNEKNVVIPSVINGRNVVALLDGVFMSNSVIENVVIPEGIKQIGENCFNNCGHLKTVAIPDTVENVGNFAFYKCISLEKVRLGKNLSTLGNSVFGECYELSEFTVSSNNSNFTAISGVLYSKDMMKLCCYPPNKTNTAFEIPNTVKYIEESAFYACTKLVSVKFPSSLIGIGKMAFYYCNSIATVNLPEGTTSIGSRAFTNCTSLKSVYIPSTVKTLGSGIFNASENITAIYTPTNSPAYKWCNDNGYGDVLKQN